MNISKIPTQLQSFKARTQVIAPDSMISKKDRLQLEAFGEKIGRDSDTITISVSDVHPYSEYHNIDVYDVNANLHLTSDREFIRDSIETTMPHKYGDMELPFSNPQKYVMKILSDLKARIDSGSKIQH